jgi:hypothetical protein
VIHNDTHKQIIKFEQSTSGWLRPDLLYGWGIQFLAAAPGDTSAPSTIDIPTNGTPHPIMIDEYRPYNKTEAGHIVHCQQERAICTSVCLQQQHIGYTASDTQAKDDRHLPKHVYFQYQLVAQCCYSLITASTYFGLSSWPSSWSS